MVTAQVNFWGTLRYITDEKRVTMDLPAEFSMQQLVDALAVRCGEPVRTEMVSASHQGYLQGHVVVFVDGRSSRGDLSERFGPFRDDGSEIDIYFVPNAEGGEE